MVRLTLQPSLHGEGAAGIGGGAKVPDKQRGELHAEPDTGDNHKQLPYLGQTAGRSQGNER
jgi:hypothetical protein